MDDAVEKANIIHEAVQSIKVGIRAHLEEHMTPTQPEPGELRAIMTSQGWRYGRYKTTTNRGDAYDMYNRDVVGKLVEEGYGKNVERRNSFPVEFWRVDKTDYFGEGDVEERVIGPKHKNFPHPEGWLVDGEAVRLDELSIRIRTRLLAIRKMRPPAAQEAWEEPHRLPLDIPWGKIWRIKSFYATPRDQITWLKVMHRNLYLAGSSNEPDKTCRVCSEKENIVHLVRCQVIRANYWDMIAEKMREMGFRVPPQGLQREAFWLLGRIDKNRAVPPEQAGIMFIA